jgi:hypothetical protein
MRFLQLFAAGVFAPLAVVAAPASDSAGAHLWARENLCSLKSPPVICQPNASVTVEETALRAYQFYRAFVVDGDPRTMFSLIDKDYIVSHFGSRYFPSSLQPRDGRLRTKRKKYIYVDKQPMLHFKYQTEALTNAR